MVAAASYFPDPDRLPFYARVSSSLRFWARAVALYALAFAAFVRTTHQKNSGLFDPLASSGYMAAAFGLVYPGVALFHLITPRPSSRPLLFLTAGSVIHGLHTTSRSIFKMGGFWLKKNARSRALTFLIRTLALLRGLWLGRFLARRTTSLIGGRFWAARRFFRLLSTGAFLDGPANMGRLPGWPSWAPPSPMPLRTRRREDRRMWPRLSFSTFRAVGGRRLACGFWPEQVGGLIRSEGGIALPPSRTDTKQCTQDGVDRRIPSPGCWGLAGSLLFLRGRSQKKTLRLARRGGAGLRFPEGRGSVLTKFTISTWPGGSNASPSR